MPLDIVGPANAPNSTTIRPVDSRTFGASDTWTKDCSSAEAMDGTRIQAGFLNALIAQQRNLIRGNGQTASSIDIVTQDNADDSMALKAVQHIVQRGLMKYAADTGSANAVVAALSPALAEYRAGLEVRVKIAATNTGATTLNLNSLGTKPIVRFDGSIMQPGDLPAGMVAALQYDGTAFQLMNPSSAVQRLTSNPTLYVRTDGNDGNDGSANTPAKAFLTIQAALNYALRTFVLGGKTLNIQLGVPGTYSTFTPIPAIGAVAVLGDSANPGSYIISGSGAGGGNAVLTCIGAPMRVDGVTVSNTGTTNHTLASVSGGALTVSNVVLVAATGLPTGLGHLVAGTGGTINVSGPLLINQSGGYAVLCSTGSIATFAVTTINSSAGFTNAIVGCSACGSIQFGAGGGFSGTPAGKRYDASLNGVINTFGAGGTFIPGTVAGTTSSGGQYV